MHNLDLRLPSTANEASLPTLGHRLTLDGHGTASTAPLLATDTHNPRVPGRIESFARQVRREGLPVARLWENKTALVHLGLNQKGKPGLWLVQKVQ